MKSHIVMVHSVVAATVSYSHGLASLAAVLLASGYSSDDIVLVTLRNDDIEAGGREILTHNPSIVLVSAMSNQWNRVERLAAILKKEATEIPLCIGGTHVSAAPDSVIDSAYDVCVVGEAEGIITSIVRGKSASAYNTIFTHRIKKFADSIVVDLNSLPMPHLEMFDKRDILEYPSVMFSRGCPYECTYCMSRKGGFGGKVRWKSPQRAICESLQLISYAQPEEIYIDDDCFLKNPSWVIEFCRLYRDSIDIPFYCNTRPESVSPDLVRCLVDANCAAIGIGIESGSERIRRSVLDRNISDQTILRAFDIAHAAGLKTWSFNMIGLPGETAEDLQTTIELNDLAQTEFIRVSIFTPFPGTPIYDGTSHIPSYHGYIKKPRHLSADLYPLYKEWIFRLKREGRLWFTESECELIFNK